MVVTVRAAIAACLGFGALTAAAPAPTAGMEPGGTTAAAAVFITENTPETTTDVTQAPVETALDRTTTDAPASARTTGRLTEDQRCLAAAVYYEARGEPLAGQFAVAHVILNRVRSGRFAPTPCGVVRQRGQFSFAERSFAPSENADWRKAVAVALTALSGGGSTPARGAMYFHASYVAPGWGRAEIATIGRHVFYR